MPGEVPKKVEDIVKALKRENPDWEEEKYWKIAWATYKKMNEEKLLEAKFTASTMALDLIRHYQEVKRTSLKDSGKILAPFTDRIARFQIPAEAGEEFEVRTQGSGFEFYKDGRKIGSIPTYDVTKAWNIISKFL